jgi:hypothetical protein
MIALPDGTARLAVPAGAVTSETTITVTMTNAAAPPGVTADGAVFKFEPDGLVFAKPVAVTLAFRSSVHPTVYWSNAVGGYDQIGGSVEGSAITAEVMHFSSGFVGELATDSGTDGETSGTGGPGGSVGGGGVGGNLGTGGPAGSVGSGGASGSLGNDGCAGIGFPGGSMSTADPCGAFTMPNPASAGLPNPVAYVRNADGTVTDNVTGRTWEGSVDPGSYTQAQAITYCSNKGGGWRLPTRLEMVSLVDFTIAPPGAMINQTYFTNTPADVFWTSSKFVGVSCTGWDVSTADGSVTSADNHGARRVRCVLAAAPKCYPARYQILPGGLVHDQATALTWQQSDSVGGSGGAGGSGGSTWSAAKTYCAGLGSGWRLPSYGELQTINDDTTWIPAIDGTAFPNTPDGAYWTSSPLAGSSGNVWFVDFNYGGTGHRDVATGGALVRCVR